MKMNSGHLKFFASQKVFTSPTLITSKRMQDLAYIANRLIRFASGYSFNGPDREVKSELYAKAYMLYNIA